MCALLLKCWDFTHFNEVLRLQAYVAGFNVMPGIRNVCDGFEMRCGSETLASVGRLPDGWMDEGGREEE